MYDAQFSASSTDRQPIPQGTIDRVLYALARFKETCAAFGVKDENLHILATEATRVAPNSEAFMNQIRETVGPGVHFRLLAKEDEGRVGAFGVASSLHNVQGMMMDLGGGSTQLSWVVCKDGNIDIPEGGSISMPYGAAALSRRLKEANSHGGTAQKQLFDEVKQELEKAASSLRPLPQALQDVKKTHKGIPLYVSGGGFRGWGYVLMSIHPVQPYPIPIINGFRVPASSFFAFDTIQSTVVSPSASATSAGKDGEVDIFRVSSRRASQVPAVAHLVQCLNQALSEEISYVYFCQGGVREGALYREIPSELRKVPPLWESCLAALGERSGSLEDNFSNRNHIFRPFAELVASDSSFKLLPEFASIPKALTLILYLHGPMPKDLRAACAVRCTTAGALAAAHGLSHFERASVAIALCERWGGRSDLSSSDVGFYDRLLKLISFDTGAQNAAAWWCIAIGRLGAVIGEFYPAGMLGKRADDDDLHTKWEWSKQKEIKLRLDFTLRKKHALLDEAVWKALTKLSKCGKKKNWPDGYGHKLSLSVSINGQKTELPDKAYSLDDD